MKDQIKKMLYKQKPMAERSGSSEGNVYYSCVISESENKLNVGFKIPDNEANFESEISAHLLCRWIHSVVFN